MLTHEQIWRGIDRLAERHGLSPSGLARRAGLDPTTFNRSKRRTREGKLRWPSTESLAKILEATGTSFREFVALVEGDGNPPPPARRLRMRRLGELDPLRHFDASGFPTGEWDEVDGPHVDDADAYAIELDRDVAPPAYRSGDLVVLSPRAAVRRADRVLLCTRSGELLFGVLDRRTLNRVVLEPLDPERPPRELPQGDVAWMVRIVWLSQ